MYNPAMILGIDLGLRRIGVARSRSGVLVEPVATITLKQGELTSEVGYGEALLALRQLASDGLIGALVCGLPLDNQGKRGKFAEKLAGIARSLANDLGTKLVFEDETLTTNVGGDDASAAAIILDQYLQNHRHSEEPQRGDDESRKKLE